MCATESSLRRLARPGLTLVPFHPAGQPHHMRHGRLQHHSRVGESRQADLLQGGAGGSQVQPAGAARRGSTPPAQPTGQREERPTTQLHLPPPQLMRNATMRQAAASAPAQLTCRAA